MKRKTKIIAYIFSLGIVFVLGIFVGTSKQVMNTIVNDEGVVEINKVISLYSTHRSSEVSFDQYWEVWDKIKEKHINQPVNDVDLFYASIEGLVEGLHDPYSVYFSPEKAAAFAADLSGEFDGIGAEIGLRDGQLTVIAPLSKSPAEEAGLHPGDKIFAIDGKDISGMSLDESVGMIRGKKGTEVILSITQNGFSTMRDVSIIRDTISVPTVDWEMKDNNIVYLHISYFNETTWHEFDTAVRDILLASPRGIVLDLRSNPGGYLDTSVRVASEWVDSGVIVSEKFNDGEENTYESEGTHRLLGIPTMVLIDEGTASGSEIVAGALQDYGIATVIGQTTFGKGSVQDFEVLSDGSALKLTIAKWYTPKGRQIDGIGIDPDEAIEDMFVQKEGTEGVKADDYVDKGLERALEYLGTIAK